MASAPTEFIHMGTLTRPHGIKGEVCVHWHADSFELLGKVFYLQAGTETPLRVENAKVRLHRGQPLLLLPHIVDRTAAETLRGVRILVDRAALPPLDEGEAYVHDLLGATVIDHATGQIIGTLEHIEFPAGQDVWSIRTAAGEEVLFPAVPEFIVQLDMQNATIHIAPPAGLLDIYLKPSTDAS